MKKKIEIVQDDDKPVPAKIMAQAILDLSKAMKALSSTPLKKETIVILICHKTKLTQHQVYSVLDALEHLEKNWLK